MKTKALLLGVAMALAVGGGMVSALSTNGRGGVMPAYYDGELLLANFKELPPGGETATLEHNPSLNTIFQSDDCMPDGEMFVSVLDAIQGDGFNPLWQEVQIVFDNPAFPCQQLTSDSAIDDAFDAGLISLHTTDEVYRCAVVGPAK